jgi:hypothetical protein
VLDKSCGKMANPNDIFAGAVCRKANLGNEAEELRSPHKFEVNFCLKTKPKFFGRKVAANMIER